MTEPESIAETEAATCIGCGERMTRSAITGSVVATSPNSHRVAPLVMVDQSGRMHLHDVLIAEKSLYTWRGFVGHKLGRARTRLAWKFRELKGKH